MNVPLDGGRITDDTRITSVLPTIEHCLKSGASLVLASHLGRPKGKPDPKYSLKPVAARPVWAILGGAKVSDKLALVDSLLSRVDGLLIGGGMAFTFLAALGHAIGRSLVESDRIGMARAALERARSRGVPLRLPVDVVV